MKNKEYKYTFMYGQNKVYTYAVLNGNKSFPLKFGL